MWTWLKMLFGGEPDRTVEPGDPAGLTEQVVAEDLLPVQATPSSFLQELREGFEQAVREEEEKRAQAEQRLLGDGKLKEYIKAAIAYSVKELSSQAKEYALISDYDIGVPEDAWPKSLGICSAY